MLERLLLKHLTKKGIILYFVGLLVLFALVAYYVLGIAGYTLKTGRNIFFFGIVIVNLIWAGICYLMCKKKEDNNE